MKLSIFAHLIIFGVLVVEVAFASETSRHATACEINSKKGSLIFKEKFDNNLDAWLAEYVAKPGSSIRIENKKLVMDVAGGATFG